LILLTQRCAVWMQQSGILATDAWGLPVRRTPIPITRSTPPPPPAQSVPDNESRLADVLQRMHDRLDMALAPHKPIRLQAGTQPHTMIQSTCDAPRKHDWIMYVCFASLGLVLLASVIYLSSLLSHNKHMLHMLMTQSQSQAMQSGIQGGMSPYWTPRRHL